ncbi:hypothetical protein BLOT_003970 [Blomia tropicalis]|nr:hypothetical protein BLOT_003970 [Blomia tropicalis]
MPIDAVWIMATVPQKKFERTLITFSSNQPNLDGQFFEDYYEEKGTIRRQYMEKILEESLENLNIYDAVWVSSKNGHYFHVYFTCDLNGNDHAMHYLQSKGIGSRCNSTIGYIPFGLFYYNEKPDPNDPLNYNDYNSTNYFNDVKDSFIKSVTSRLTVAQVVEGVKNGAEITFDYYMYLLWSSVIAAMGMMNTSSVDVAASMMIEPLMGAVMAISFGLAIHNKEIFWTGIRSLVVGMTFCLIFGYLFGMLFMVWRVAWNPPPDGTWPTPEMQSRGQYRTLIYGAVIAASGGAVLAVILLKNNFVAMTGVAVATTFMPPFVNAGLCFALATHLQITGQWEQYQEYNIDGAKYRLKPSWAPPNGYQVQYYYDMRLECCILALISLAYTFVNVFFLLAFSYITLKIKEIAPIRTLMPSDHKFFSEDIKVYQAHNKRYSSSGHIGKQILEEWADLSGLNKNELLSNRPDAKVTQIQTLQDIADEVELDPNYQTITRNAFGNKYQPQLRRRLTHGPEDGEFMSQIRNRPLNNIGIYSVERDFQSGAAEMANRNNSIIPSKPYASSGRSGSIPLRYSVNSPYSVWPSREPQICRSRSSSTVSSRAQIYKQIDNNLYNSKL